MTSRVFEPQDVPLRTLVSEASLIVEGTVSAERQYLSADRRKVYTDYDIIPSRTFFARGTLTQTTPGPSRLVVRKFGGIMKIDGVAVHVLDETVAPLNVGERILAFLAESSDAGKFDLLFEIGGFVLKDDGVVPLVTSQGVLRAVRGMTPSQFSELVAEEVATRQGSGVRDVQSSVRGGSCRATARPVLVTRSDFDERGACPTAGDIHRENVILTAASTRWHWSPR